ncbi:Phage-related minor tail protein [Serratia entomophila]|uniref:tape measure protein n=1 Tax=Serratia entomophila TaxID=42906 RepID=UPI001F4185A7|nr:tape measure protein [Serratia entomophila]UIW19320.1 tape measure protein [Serratia entomophila]CAI0816601.1 Phage-related minor tail protein [Serratia entomophila]CAI0881485.1 Phage-related minor tail protein [Serratia entomophila]CAI1052512.1 Phage-related minor tail protein [Serratia entomophila]CAI1060119.1 Phage-related minor tail protein [Serratia entomophila]
MASKEQVGNIVYEVEMNVANLLKAQRQVNERLDTMDERFKRSAKSSDTLSTSVTRLAGAVSAAISVQQVAKYADAWTTVNNKLANSVKANEDLATVTQRVFSIAQDTRAALDATASLYQRLERATRSYGTSVDDVARLTTIINQGFVVSGATAQEASNAVIQLSQGLASGALRGEEFNSVTEQGGRLATALADSLGVNIGQLRAMAAEGKLTTDVVVKGLLSQGDAIGKEFANTTTTIGQALEIANNNITQFIGSSTTVKSTVSLFNSSIITLSENLDVVAKVIGSVAAIVGTRYAAALTLAVAGQVKLAATAFAASTSLSAFGAAAALARGALALIGGPAGAAVLAASAIFYFYQRAKEARQAAIELADGVNTLLGKMKDMSATEIAASIAKLRGAIPELTGAVKDASDEYDKASKRVANLQREVEQWGTGTTRGRQAAEALTGAVDNQSIAFAELDRAQRNLSQTQSAVGIASAQLNGTFEQGIGLLSRHGEQAGFAAGMMNQLGRQLNFAAGAQEKFNASNLKITRPKNVQDYLDGLQDQVELQAELNDKKRAQLKAEQQIRRLGGTEADVVLARERAAAEYDSLQAQQEQKKATKEGIAEGKKSASQAESVAQKLANLKQQSELAASSTTELSREQAILTAQQSLGKGATQAQVTLAGEYAAKAWDAAAAAKGVTEAIKAMPEKAENKSYAESMQNLKAALDAGKIDLQEYNTATEKMALEHQNNLAKINSQAVVNPVASARAEVDPVQQLANENAQKLALMQQYQQQEQAILLQSYQQGKISYDQFILAKQATDDQYLALRTAQEKQYQEQQTAAQWQLLSQQSVGYDMLTSAVDAFSGNASNAITGLLTGTMSAQEAMRSLGNTILNSVINSIVQVGVEMLKNFIIGQALGSASTANGLMQAALLTNAWTPAAYAASVATGGAAAKVGAVAYGSGLATSMALSNVAGARYNGGPVSAGAMYQVGERGKPEIYQASTGKQYMIPGDNGKVISNRDMQGGGGVNVQVNVNNQTSGTAVQNADAYMQDGNVVVDLLLTDLERGGPVSSQMQQTFGLNRRASGSF